MSEELASRARVLISNVNNFGGDTSRDRQFRQAVQLIADLISEIEQLREDFALAIRVHLEEDPHLYPDGSS